MILEGTGCWIIRGEGDDTSAGGVIKNERGREGWVGTGATYVNSDIAQADLGK